MESKDPCTVDFYVVDSRCSSRTPASKALENSLMRCSWDRLREILWLRICFASRS